MSVEVKSNHNWIVDNLLLALQFLFRVAYEPFRAAWRGDPNVIWKFGATCAMFTAFILGIDGKFLLAYGKSNLYDSKLYPLLQFAIGSSPLFYHGILHATLRTMFIFELRNSFDRSGLRNALREYPGFVGLESKDSESLKLRLTNNGMSINEWRTKKERIEANLRVFVDNIDMVQDKGIVEIVFSTSPMPTLLHLNSLEKFRGYRFSVGQNRTSHFEIDFTSDPHLLIAGESGGGKSFFIRQMLATIKFNHPETVLKIADLKNGADFKCFEHVNRVDLVFDPRQALGLIEGVVKQIQNRMEKLKNLGHDNLSEYHKSESFLSKSSDERLRDECGHRIFVVVDEFAELVLSGGILQSTEVKTAKEGLSKISRLGRSCGIHLILATQRPDRNVVDVQVRSNLTSTICFRLNDLGGSLAVLGSKSACELPQIKGRGIYLRGADEFEIQTPLLLPQKIDEILTPQKKEVADDNGI